MAFTLKNQLQYNQEFLGICNTNATVMKDVAFSCNIYGQKRKNVYTIYVNGSVGGERYTLPTNIHVEIKHWNPKKNEVRATHPLRTDLALLLEKKLMAAKKIALNYRLHDRRLTKSLLELEWIDPNSTFSFLKFVKENIELLRVTKKYATSTLYQHYAMLDLLTQFKKQILFSDINEKFVRDFEIFLRVVEEKKDSSVSTNMKKLAKHVGDACELPDIKMQNPFKESSYEVPKYNVKRLVYLTLEERSKLEEYYFSSFIPEHLKKVLRGFLFSCYTGLRFSDLELISRSELTPNDTIKLIPKKTRKFKKEVEIPLIGRTRDFIAETNLTLFPQLPANQVFNRHLKEIAKTCGIKKNLTSHVGRHTFGSLFIEAGGDVTTLQELLGHSDINDTMVYVHIHASKKRSDMKKFAEYQLSHAS